MAIKIITDSTCDLPQEIVEQYNIEVLPLKVIFGKKEYVDGIDLTVEQFYSMLVEAKDLPTTSQVTPEQFNKVYEKAKADGDDVISIHISSDMSGTLQSANISKDHVEYDKIHLVDSRTVTVQLGMMVVEACRMKESGASVDEILARLDEMVEKTVLYASIATLEYLKKGGRIKASSAAIGSALNIKPIITIADGLVESIGKARGTKKSFEEIKKLIENSGTTLDGKEIYIGHASDTENMAKLKEFLLKHYKPSKVVECVVGACVGTHAGPGCVTVAFEQ
ncbi:MAG: DegV family protein [Eubacteriales bacterium]